jgi:hypothetical protein
MEFSSKLLLEKAVAEIAQLPGGKRTALISTSSIKTT